MWGDEVLGKLQAIVGTFTVRCLLGRERAIFSTPQTVFLLSLLSEFDVKFVAVGRPRWRKRQLVSGLWKAMPAKRSSM